MDKEKKEKKVKMSYLFSEAAIKDITRGLKAHRPHVFTAYDSTDLIYQILILKRKKFIKINMDDIYLTGDLLNGKKLEQVSKEVFLYFNEILPLEVFVELRTDFENRIYIYIWNKQPRFEPTYNINRKDCKTWGESSSDELGLVTNSEMKTVFRYNNTLFSLKHIDKMLNKIHKLYYEGERINHNHNEKNQYYDDDMLLLLKYLGDTWGGKVIFRPTQYLTTNIGENVCLVLEFEPDKDLDGLYKLFKKGVLGNVC